MRLKIKISVLLTSMLCMAFGVCFTVQAASLSANTSYSCSAYSSVTVSFSGYRFKDDTPGSLQIYCTTGGSFCNISLSDPGSSYLTSSGASGSGSANIPDNGGTFQIVVSKSGVTGGSITITATERHRHSYTITTDKPLK